MNTELLSKLQQAEEKLLKYGYCLDFGTRYHVEKVHGRRFGRRTPDTCLVVTPVPFLEVENGEFTSSMDDVHRLVLTVQPDGLPDSDIFTFEQSKVFCDYWGRVLNVCQFVNDLGIVGTKAEIKECIREMQDKRRNSNGIDL